MLGIVDYTKFAFLEAKTLIWIQCMFKLLAVFDLIICAR